MGHGTDCASLEPEDLQESLMRIYEVTRLIIPGIELESGHKVTLGMTPGSFIAECPITEHCYAVMPWGIRQLMPDDYVPSGCLTLKEVKG